MAKKANEKTIIIAPGILKWARVSIGLDIELAAKRLKVKVEELSNWEENETKLPLRVFRKLSNTYKRPTAVFFLDEPPQDTTPKEFRKHQEDKRINFTHDFFMSLRRAKYLQEITKELNSDASNDLINFLQSLNSSDPELAAQKLLKKLEIDLQEFNKISDAFTKLKSFKLLLDSRGIITLELGFNPYEARAFGLFDSSAPVIALSTKDSPKARVFSLFHELAHFIYGVNGIDVDEDMIYTNGSIEAYCNEFSASFLVPKELLLNELKSIDIKKNPNLQEIEPYVNQLADKFCVSQQVIYIRLKKYGIIPETTYTEYSKKLDKKTFRYKMKGKGGDYYKNTIKNTSPLVINTVLDAFNRNVITSTDVSRYLNVKIEKIGKLENYLYSYIT